MNCNAMHPHTFDVLVQWVRSPRGGGSDSFIAWIVRMHTLGLSPAQITSHYKKKNEGIGKGKKNDSIVRNGILL